MKVDKKNYSQVHLEKIKYELQKKKMTRVIDVELDLVDSDNFDSK